MMNMKRTAALGLSMTLMAGTMLAEEGSIPKGVPHLDHVFVIMMENHGYSQIVGNPNAPFINKLAKSANTARKYFAVAHPSLTNYLEVTGGSNFGIHTDNYPDWHSTTCKTNLSTGMVSTDHPASALICPITGHGTDAATPALDYTNEVPQPPNGKDAAVNIDGTKFFLADPNIDGKTIADQLVAHGMSWKSYQESLPLVGADLINVSDGFYTNLTDFTAIKPTLVPPLTSDSLVYLYAVKHNPFVYFQNVQEGLDSNLSLKQTVGFDGPHGLFSDLGSGKVPTYSFIVPNQCNDQHGRGNAGAFCNFDPTTNGTQAGLNPALIQRGDQTVELLVNSIKKSPVWKEGKSAIVILWDENDYSLAPNTNQVLVIVDTNYGVKGFASPNYYNHFALLKTIEGGLGLPCLNHACDDSAKVMSDLFASGDRDDRDGDDDQ